MVADKRLLSSRGRIDASRREGIGDMIASEIRHFLLIYDIPARVTRVRSFGTDYDAAQAAYAEIGGDL